MSRASFTRAFQHARAAQSHLPACPPARPCAPGLLRHAAAVAPVLAQPISIFRPRADDDASRQESIRDCFRSARRIR